MSPPRRLPSALRTGFSLVEILVVVAIISVLAGLLLVVVPTVRSSARTLVCLSSMRQMGLATASYAADSHGLVPPTKTHTGLTPLTALQCPYGAFHLDLIKDYLEDEWKASGEDNFKGVLWGCPEFTALIHGGPAGAYGVNAAYSGYVRNAYLTWSSTNPWGQSDNIYDMCAADGTRLWGQPGYFRFSAIPLPDRVCLFGEGACNLLNWYIDPAKPGVFSDQIEVYFQGQPRYIDQLRHRGRSNVLFCDLHTETVRPLAYWYALAAPDQSP